MLIPFCVGNERHVFLYRLRFSGVTEENVDSIMRRTAVCRFKSSFVDMAKLPDMEDREKLAASSCTWHLSARSHAERLSPGQAGLSRHASLYLELRQTQDS